VTIDRSTRFDQLPELLRPEEFAACTAISKGLVYELARRGELPCIRLGRLLRIPREAVIAMKAGDRV
jgi:excisionase family DNA binding protein